MDSRKHTGGYVTFDHAKLRNDGREYAKQGSMQSLPGSIRALVGHHLYDIDFDCSHPANLLDCLRATEIEVPEILYTAITKRLEIRQTLAQYYNT